MGTTTKRRRAAPWRQGDWPLWAAVMLLRLERSDTRGDRRPRRRQPDDQRGEISIGDGASLPVFACLGLAIVRSADVHDATVTAQPRAGGGLGTNLAFPAPN